MEDEAEGEDLETRLYAEDPEEVHLRGLELLCEYGLVVLRQMLLEGEDHAIGDDGEQDGVFEGRPLDNEARVLSYAIILRKNEQRCGALAASPTATRPSTLIPAWRHVHQTRYLKAPVYWSKNPENTWMDFQWQANNSIQNKLEF